MNPTEWLLTEGWGYSTTKELVSRLCRHLVEDCGIPLSRLFCFVRILHPQVFANSYTWRRTTGTVDSESAPYEELESALYRDSPCAVLSEGAAAIRRRLDISHPWLDYPILHDLRAEGAADYVAMPVPFTDGRSRVPTVPAAKASSDHSVWSLNGQYLENRTIRDSASVALCDHLTEAFFEAAEIFKLAAHLGEMRRDDDPNVIASVILFINQAQKVSDFVEGKTEFSVASDETKALDLIRCVNAVATRRPAGLRHDTDALVVTNGLNIAACQFGNFADRHALVF